MCNTSLTLRTNFPMRDEIEQEDEGGENFSCFSQKFLLILTERKERERIEKILSLPKKEKVFKLTSRNSSSSFLRFRG